MKARAARKLPHSGTMRVTWAKCSNKSCPSQQWDVWNVDFVNDRFFCGTCGLKLMPPIFLCSLEFRDRYCPLCLRDDVQPPR